MSATPSLDLPSGHMLLGKTSRSAPFTMDCQALQRSIRHHRRAIRALAERRYGGLDPSVRQRLFQHLRSEVSFLEAQLPS